MFRGKKKRALGHQEMGVGAQPLLQVVGTFGRVGRCKSVLENEIRISIKFARGGKHEVF